jgi:putative endonuclease
MVFPHDRTTGASASTNSVGDVAEDAALRHLQQAGLRLVQRNYRTPGRGGGEIDLIMRTADGTTVFVEVRRRACGVRGGRGGASGRR